MDGAADMRTLRRRIKGAATGTGAIMRMIRTCTFNLSARGFTMLIVSCKQSGDHEKAMEIFEAMEGSRFRDAGVLPNFYSHSALISVCCAAGACSEGLQILKLMMERAQRDPAVQPDLKIYEMLIATCHSQNLVEDVKTLYELLKPGWKMKSASILVCMLEVYSSEGLWNKSFEMLDALMGLEAEISLKTFTTLLAACTSQDAPQTAVEVFLALQMAGVIPDQVVCYHMMRALSAAPSPELCLELLLSMQDAGVAASCPTFKQITEILQNLGVLHMLDEEEILSLSMGEWKLWREGPGSYRIEK